MNNKILAGAIIALIVLAAGIYFVYKSNQSSNTSGGSNTINAPTQPQTSTSASQNSAASGGSKYGGLSSDLTPSAQQTDTVPSGETNIPP